MVDDSDAIRLGEYPDKTLIFNAHNLDPTIHKRTLAEQVVGCSYEYVRRLFAELSRDEVPAADVEAVLDEELQRDLARRLLAHGVSVDTELDVETDDSYTVPPANLDGYVVPAADAAEVRDALADTRDLMVDMGEDSGEAVATMAIRKLDGLLRTAQPE